MFLARDVAEVINYARNPNGAYNIAMMLKTIPEDEKLVSTIFIPGQNGNGQRRKSWFVTENGLYTVFMQSRKPLALQYKKKL